MSQPTLITGGAGYIGSHTTLQLLEAGHQVVVLDNLSNSSRESLTRIERITGKKIEFIEGDIRDAAVLQQLFQQHAFKAVIHFAGLKAVGESVQQPLRYYQNNIAGTLNLLEVMDKAGCKNLVFSSSATVYGDPARLPITEDMPRSATNPYGRSKLIIEEMLEDLFVADPSWKIISLRYFNPVGAHPSGLIGEDPSGIPNNLMPFISQVASGQRDRLAVFGDDYETVDGTGVRDYIHVMDLAAGHLSALDYLQRQTKGVCLPVNLGTGHGISVLQMVQAFEQASGVKVAYEMQARRPGDVAICYADAAKAERVLGWRAKLDVQAMCIDTWNWQKLNPRGYGS